MRRSLLMIVSAASLLTAAGSASAAPIAYWDYPYCLQGRDWGYPGLCQFSTYQQCLATASGTFSYCGINPRFAFARQQSRY
jgi:Protein of unknown function (DUF3551)